MQIEFKKMSKISDVLEATLSELHEIKCHIANERPFKAGVRLGGLMTCLCNELEKSLQEDEDEKVQGKECDEECEEGSEEEDEDGDGDDS